MPPRIAAPFPKSPTSDTAGPMPADDADVVEAARRAYADDRETVVEIAARLGVSSATIRRWRRENQWPLRSVRRTAAETAMIRRRASSKRAASKANAATATPTSDPRSRAALIERLYRAIFRKLEHLETSMETTDPPSATDNDRETRAIGTLIRNVEKVAELETDLTRPDATAAGAKPASLYGGEDADGRRRELAERILKVRERHRERTPE